MNLGTVPSRVIDIPETADVLPPSGAKPTSSSREAGVWHYTQTDANRHVNSMGTCAAWDFVASALAARGHDLRVLYPAQARIVYRKPCFRGERYERAAWLCGDSPLVVAARSRKHGERPDAPPIGRDRADLTDARTRA